MTKIDNNNFRIDIEGIGKLFSELSKVGQVMDEIYFDKIAKKFELLREELIKDLGEMPELIIKSQDILFSRSWYVFGDISLRDMTAVVEMSDEEIEELMVTYAKQIKLNTLNRINEHFPERAKIIAEAIKAHDQKLYSLSVPVLLAQADGITNKLLGVSLYTKKDDNPKTKAARMKFFAEDDCITDMIFLRPLDRSAIIRKIS